MNFKGFSILAVTILAAVYVCVCGTYNYINYSYPLFIESLEEEIAEKTKLVKAQPVQIDNSPLDTNESQTSSENSENTSETAAAVSAGGGQAIGKITEKFISPYGANTSYGKVYLKNNTGTQIDLPALISKKLSFKIEKNDKPQILLIHTHTTESYMLNDQDYYTEEDKSRRLEEDKNMIAVGDVFEKKLREAGIGVIHDKTVHDYPSYSGSYSRAAETILKDLKAYPSIKIIIDIHRDAISAGGNDRIKPVAEINGKKYAQVMLVMGSQTGDIKNFPNWQDNLSLAVKYQQTMEVKYPGLARAITLNSAKYNENISRGSLLLEVGSESNTLDEAKNAAEAAADALATLMNTLK